MAECYQGIKPECADIHERVRVMEALNKTRDLRDAEFQQTLKEFADIIKQFGMTMTRIEEKLDRQDKDIDTLKNRQWKIASGAVMALLGMLWGIIKKYL